MTSWREEAPARAARWLLVGAALALPAGLEGDAEAARRVSAPMTCSRGGDQRFEASVATPSTVEEGGTYLVRIDAVPSGKISQLGLNHIRDMTTDFGLPRGASYVEGSARVVPGSGTDNARDGAKVTVSGRTASLLLPARIENGSSYTPPSFELRLRASSPAGTALPFDFLQYRVTANAIVVGDVHVTCDPTPKPFTIAATRVVAASPAPLWPRALGSRTGSARRGALSARG